MKLKDLVFESTIVEMRKEIGILLGESIAEYMSQVVAVLKAKSPEEVFGDQPKVDLDQLANIVTGMKVLSNKEYRAAMTKDDIGLNPGSAKEVFDLLKSVPKDGKNLPKASAEIFNALKELAPSLAKKEAEKFAQLKDGDEADRKKIIDELAGLSSKIGQMFQKVKTTATSGASATA